MAKHSAGLLPYRLRREASSPIAQVFLVHPGGPFWQGKDDGAWSIVKGEYDPDVERDPSAVARREFQEETGQEVPSGEWLSLGELTQPGGKGVVAWAIAGDVDANAVASNTFELEWPPKSGRVQSFPEVDRGAWFEVGTARVKILKGQAAFLDLLLKAVRGTNAPAPGSPATGSRGSSSEAAPPAGGRRGTSAY
jgi:predicted NUDIX family NTP pyrophosphohydrolase